ncbi:MAG: glycosyltransferase family 4 protein [Nocardioides sp.]|uniref:glycosyltransferase family 4 protein n=1 Tax=Nocardioides sp. TaxID=35761 RepID=UPI0039E54F45
MLPFTPVQTHLGEVMDRFLTRVGRGLAKSSGEPDDVLLRSNFHALHYLNQSPSLTGRDRLRPADHFLAEGAVADRSPNPHFSMSAYLRRHPERAGARPTPYHAWLAEGSELGEIADPAPGVDLMAPVLGLSPQQVVREVVAIRSDLIARLCTGTLGEMMAKAAEIEPMVADAWREVTRPKIPSLVAEETTAQVAAIFDSQRQAGFRPARLVMVVNRPRWGSGRRLEGHLAHGLVETGRLRAEDIVVIYTDDSGTTPPDRYPSGVREVDFHGVAGEMGQMPGPVAQRALVELIRSFHADAVININSRLLYESLITHGPALVATERVFVVFFCNEQNARGTWSGYPMRYFYRQFEQVAGCITDSAYLRDWFRERYLVPPDAGDRIHVFPAPVDVSIPVTRGPGPVEGRRPRVYWAGRWDRQKLISVVLRTARLMPEADFHLWGEAVLQGEGPDRNVPDNVVVHGRYDSFAELRLDEADVWLYTSGWDGVPSQLLEVAMTGLPIVGSLVGGTGEVLGVEDSWPVAEVNTPEAYVQAITQVLADPAEARRRALALRERLVAERTVEAYADLAGTVLLGPKSEDADV